MKTKSTLLFIFVLGLISSSFAQQYEVAFPTLTDPQYKARELNATYLNSEKARREDEFATSLKRRNFLKDRLIVQAGFGSKYFAHINEESQVFLDVAYGFGIEYIATNGLAFYVTYGQFNAIEDEGVPEQNNGGVITPAQTIAGGFGSRIGIGYYFLPKFALHPGVSVSYGKTLVGHRRDADLAGYRTMVSNSGFNFDANITYLDYNFWYLTINAGVGLSSENASLEEEDGELKSIIIDEAGFDKTSGFAGTKTWNPVFGFGIGIAFADIFPDITEKRRRERAKAFNRIR